MCMYTDSSAWSISDLNLNYLRGLHMLHLRQPLDRPPDRIAGTPGVGPVAGNMLVASRSVSFGECVFSLHFLNIRISYFVRTVYGKEVGVQMSEKWLIALFSSSLIAFWSAVYVSYSVGTH